MLSSWAQATKIAAVVANAPGVDLFKGIKGRYVPPNMRGKRRSRWPASLFIVATLDATRGRSGCRRTTSCVRAPRSCRFRIRHRSDLADVERNAPSWRNGLLTDDFFHRRPRYRDGDNSNAWTAPLMVTLARDNEVVVNRFVKEKVDPTAARVALFRAYGQVTHHPQHIRCSADNLFR